MIVLKEIKRLIERFRGRVYSVLVIATEGDQLSRSFDIFIVALISLNVLALILGTVPAIKASSGRVLRWFEIISVSIFTLEYLLRIWSCTANEQFQHPIRGRLRHAATGMLAVDLLAIVPFYLALGVPAGIAFDLRFLRSIRLMRTFRLLKLGRYSEAMKTLGRVFQAKKAELGITLFIGLLLLVMSSSLVYFAEHSVQPDAFPSIPAAMWWGVITLTAVGYGDVVPITALGKAFGTISAILCIGLFALPAGILGSGFFEQVQKKREASRTCPHCGKPIGPRSQEKG